MITVLATIGGCAVICGFTVWCCISLVNKERDQIYILDGNIPFLAERAQLEANFTMEAKAHIQLFHQYFFNLPPDNDYIKWTLGKAMYMADGTALKQKQAMDENGFYSDGLHRHVRLHRLRRTGTEVHLLRYAAHQAAHP